MRAAASAFRGATPSHLKIVVMADAAGPATTLSAAAFGLYDAKGKNVAGWDADGKELATRPARLCDECPSGIVPAARGGTDSSGRMGAAREQVQNHGIAARLGRRDGLGRVPESRSTRVQWREQRRASFAEMQSPLVQHREQRDERHLRGPLSGGRPFRFGEQLLVRQRARFVRHSSGIHEIFRGSPGSRVGDRAGVRRARSCARSRHATTERPTARVRRRCWAAGNVRVENVSTTISRRDEEELRAAIWTLRAGTTVVPASPEPRCQGGPNSIQTEPRRGESRCAAFAVGARRVGWTRVGRLGPDRVGRAGRGASPARAALAQSLCPTRPEDHVSEFRGSVCVSESETRSPVAHVSRPGRGDAEDVQPRRETRQRNRRVDVMTGRRERGAVDLSDDRPVATDDLDDGVRVGRRRFLPHVERQPQRRRRVERPLERREERQ